MPTGKFSDIHSIDERVKKLLTYHNIDNFEQFLLLTDVELLKCGLMPCSIKDLKLIASKALAPVPTTAYKLKNQGKEKLPTTIKKLDTYLNGGFRKGTLADITGPPAVGKTQFSLVMCVSAHISSKISSILYFDVCYGFSSHRLLQIACEINPELFKETKALKELCEKIEVLHPLSLKEILEWFSCEKLFSRQKISLVIIDSITPLVRMEKSGEVYMDLIALAQTLKTLAEKYNFIVIITNQITSTFQPVATGNNKELVEDNDSSESVVSALGATWCHNVLMRIILQFTRGPQKQFLIAKSNNVPFTGFNYQLTKEGLTFYGEHFLYEGTNPCSQRIRTQTPIKQDLEI